MTINIFTAQSLRIIAAIVALLLAPGVLAQGDNDPWQSINRKVFTFNDTLDRYLLKPTAKAYKKVTPTVVDDGITNMFANLGDCVTVLNDVLQWKLKKAGIASSRVLINSTLGMFGFFDVASKLHLREDKEDFGQTFQYWGISSGPYVMLPFFGPSTITDGIGLVPDTYSNPLDTVDHVRTRNGAFIVNVIDKRADLLKAEGLISGDRYIFIRDAYLQRRTFLLNDGEVQDDFGDEDFDSF